MDLKKPRFRQKFTRWTLVLLLLIGQCNFSTAAAHYLKELKLNCLDFGANLNYLVKLADVVLSGTVERLNLEENDYSEFAEVRIWRVMKGIERTGISPLDIYRRYRNSRERPLIVVHGLKNPDICDSFARLGDTKIFLLTQTGESEFRLNSSLLPLTLDNLDSIDAASRGEPQDLICHINETSTTRVFDNHSIRHTEVS